MRLDEPVIQPDQRVLPTYKFKVVVPHKLRDQLANLQQTNILANTRPGTQAEWKEVPFHCACLRALVLALSLEPPFWFEDVRIGAKDGFVVVRYPRVDSYYRLDAMRWDGLF